MYVFIFIIQTVLAGVFGWFTPDIMNELERARSYTGLKERFHPWKVMLLWCIYISALFTASYMGVQNTYKKTYDTSKYEIVYGTDEMPIDSTTFKIIKK